MPYDVADIWEAFREAGVDQEARSMATSRRPIREIWNELMAGKQLPAVEPPSSADPTPGTENDSFLRDMQAEQQERIQRAAHQIKNL